MLSTNRIDNKILFERYVENGGFLNRADFERTIYMYAQHNGIRSIYNVWMVELQINTLFDVNGNLIKYL